MDRIETSNSLELNCDLVSLSYDFATRTGLLTMGEGQNCNMVGCIALFRRIDPDVRLVNTYAGQEQDTSYLRERDGRWTAITHTARGPERGEFYDLTWKNKTELDEVDKSMGYRRHVSDDGAYRQFLNGKRTPGI